MNFEDQEEIQFMSTKYTVKTKTGSKDSSGTDAPVFITLHDEAGVSSQELELDNAGVDDFKRGATDTFHITVDESLGPIDAVTLRVDPEAGDGEGHEGWWCDWVEVSANGKKGHFPYSGWIADDEPAGLEVTIKRNGNWD
jgi:hypothetical protein